MRADKRARLTWTGSGQAFVGGAKGGAQITLDGDGAAGPSPMDALLLSLGACMAIDVCTILEKGRVPPTALSVDLTGARAPEPPRRYTGVRLVVRVEGVPEAAHAKVDRAVQLSKDKYCSVLHSLRPDLDLEIAVERTSADTGEGAAGRTATG